MDNTDILLAIKEDIGAIKADISNIKKDQADQATLNKSFDKRLLKVERIYIVTMLFMFIVNVATGIIAFNTMSDVVQENLKKTEILKEE